MRTAEPGGTKLIYSGPVKDGKCDKINDAINQEYISSTNETKSTIRTYIDNWYETTMTPYNSYLEDTIWCNDRNI